MYIKAFITSLVLLSIISLLYISDDSIRRTDDREGKIETLSGVLVDDTLEEETYISESTGIMLEDITIEEDQEGIIIHNNIFHRTDQEDYSIHISPSNREKMKAIKVVDTPKSDTTIDEIW